MLARTVGLGLILAFVLPLSWGHAEDQLLRLPPRPTGNVADINRNLTLVRDRRIYVTYGGNLILRFPNYDVRVVNSRDGAFLGEARGVSVVFHNDEGLYWDGRGLILTPNSPVRYWTENRYVRSTIGDPQLHWPLEKASPTVEVRVVPEFAPLMGYRSLADASAGGYVGPNHGPVIQPASPTSVGKPALAQQPYVSPFKPQLGLDGKLTYSSYPSAVPSGVLGLSQGNR